MKTGTQTPLSKIFLLLNIFLHLEIALCINNSSKVFERNATKSEKEYVEIQNAYSTRSNNLNALNPINGTDYWSTGKLNPNGYSDWIAVFNVAKIINFFEFEFDFPPSRLVVYGGLSEHHWLPLCTFDYSEMINEIIANNSKQVLIISEDYSKIQTDIAFKMIKFEFYNTFASSITVLLSKVKIGFYRDRREYLIHKLLIENDSHTHLCLRRKELTDKKDIPDLNTTATHNTTISNTNLLLVQCHYCMIYYIDDCLFTYLKTDSNGHLFSYQSGNKIQKEFYIRNLQISTDNAKQSLTEEAGTSVEIMKSFLSNKLDYDIDLKEIFANSTLNEENYSVKKVLLDDMTYWSSTMMKKPNCYPIKITMIFKKEMIIKKLSIFWLNPPFHIVLKFCEKNSNSSVDCPSKSVNDFSNLISNFEDIFLKTEKLFIFISFDQKRLKDFSYNCIASIKNIFIFKNEIDVKADNLEGDEAILYSENFYFTNFDMKKAKFSKNENLQSLDQSSKVDKTKNTINILKADFLSKIDFQLEIENLLPKLENIYKKILLHKKYEEKYKNFIKKVFHSKSIDPSKFDQPISKMLQRIHAKNKFSKIKSSINEILEIDNRILEMKKYFAFSEIQILELREDFLIFIAEKSSKFMTILTDSELKKKFESLNTLNKVKRKLQKFEDIKVLNQNLFHVKTFYLESMQSSVKIMNDTLNSIEGFLSNKMKINDEKEKEVTESMAFSLQNEKLVNLQKENYFLNFFFENDIPKCLKIKLIKNSYFDNFFVKMLIVLFSQTEENFSNIVIIKFYNENFFYFLKIDKINLQIWKRKYDSNEKLFEDSNFLNKIKNSGNNMNEKLYYVYLLIKVNEGKLSIILNFEINNKEEYINFKKSQKFLTENHNLTYLQMESFYLQNENDFKEKFEGKEIFSIFDTDIKQRGYLGYIGMEEKPNVKNNLINDNVYFFMVKKLVPVEKSIDHQNKFQRSEIFLNYVKSKFNFNFFIDFEKMLKIDIPKIFIEKLKLDSSLSKFYDTKFSVLNNFHIKFEIHFGKFLVEDSNLVESNEISNSVYLTIESERNKFFIIFEIVKMQKKFQLKIFRLSELRGKENVYRVDIEIKYQMTVLILEKKKDYIILRVKTKKSWKEDVFQNVFKFLDLNFLKIGFILNSINDSAVRNIYVSDLTKDPNEDKDIRIN